ncbi:voltage-dependent calcium channel subunit alpha-2/delta-2-like isoform X2 [Branchiostoma lanceolatum]|uniref:voltage-dependent calcium channel subunit alpha-2/delta-2-like isoform X1 n=1 Tax=Branchiostoma lanceolatum TaxID=7740 RepID=UPI0034531B75
MAARDRYIFLGFALSVSILVESVIDEELSRFLGDKEELLRSLEQDVLVGYQRKCGAQCSFDRNIYACSSPLLEEESVCSQEYGVSIYTGTGCATCANRKLSLSRSYIRTPSREATCTDTLNRDICLSQGLDSSFRENLLPIDGQETGVRWQFFTSQSGMYRMFPGVAQERCHDFDPRLRAWYVSATTGPKDVVIVIDSSDSMAFHPSTSSLTLMGLTKEAVTSVLWTLTHLDYVAVVSFATLAQQLTIQNKNTLVQATRDNIQALTQEVKKVEPNGHTNFEAAFRTAFDILRRSEVVSRTAGCNKMVLFMTDGEPTRGEREPEQLTHIISSLNQREDGSKFASIFTYSVGELADTTITKKIACTESGVWSEVETVGKASLAEQLSQYYDYYGTLREGQGQVIWTEPYKDAFGAGEVVTAAKAVYNTSTVPQTLLGVLGIDVATSATEKITTDKQDLFDTLQSRSSSCADIRASSVCELEQLRQKVYEQGTIRYENNSAKWCDLSLSQECSLPSAEPCDNQSLQYSTCMNHSMAQVDYVVTSCCSRYDQPCPSFTTRISVSLHILSLLVTVVLSCLNILQIS